MQAQVEHEDTLFYVTIQLSLNMYILFPDATWTAIDNSDKTFILGLY